MDHVHIPKLIRTLEPHLTKAQKKQLRIEVKYKDQEERFPSKPDANEIPPCASYVEQIVAGVARPGSKHEYIAHRYVEEAFKTMANLKVVEAHFMTECVAHQHPTYYTLIDAACSRNSPIHGTENFITVKNASLLTCLTQVRS